MKSVIAFFLLALASTAFGITITVPKSNATWDVSESNTIEWTTVDTDPDKVNITLVNQSVNPSTSVTIATNVSTSLLKYTVERQCNVTNGSAYQINFSVDSGIRAQSSQFVITGAKAAASACSASSSTATETATKTGSTSTSSGASSTSTSGAEAMYGRVSSELTGLGALILGAAVFAA